MIPSDYLQDPSHFSTGPQPICYWVQPLFHRTQTNCLQDPTSLSTRPHLINYMTPAIFLQDPNQFFGTLATFIQDRIQSSTGPQPWLYFFFRRLSGGRRKQDLTIYIYFFGDPVFVSLGLGGALYRHAAAHIGIRIVFI